MIMNITYHQYIIYANLHYPEQVFPQPFLLMHKILAFFSPQLKHKKQVIRMHVASYVSKVLALHCLQRRLVRFFSWYLYNNDGGLDD